MLLLLLSLLIGTANAATLSIGYGGADEYKDPVANAAALPPTGNMQSDMRVTNNDQSIYIWKPSTSSWIQAATPAATSAITALNTDVSANGPGAVVATIQPGVVTNAKMANMAAGTIKANATGGATSAQDLTVAQFKAFEVPVPQSNQIWVDKSGSDATCAMGNAGLPCLTKAGADVVLALSPAATASNRYIMNFGRGVFNATGFELKPFVYYVGVYGNGGDRYGVQSVAGDSIFAQTIINCTAFPCAITTHADFQIADYHGTSIQGLYFQGFQADIDLNDPAIASFILIQDSYITGASHGFNIKLNDASALTLDNVVIGQNSVMTGGNYVLDGRSGGSFMFSTAEGNGIGLNNIYSDAIICFTQTGVVPITVMSSALAFTGGNYIDCSTFDDDTNFFIQQSSPYLVMGDNPTLAIAEYNTYWNVFTGSGPTYWAEAILQLARGIAQRTVATVYGTRAAPISVTSTGLVTNGTNISTSAVDQVVFVAGSTANALTTITAATPISICILPAATSLTTGKGNHLEIIGTSATNPVLLPWKTGKLEIKGDFILANGSSIRLTCDGTVWREISRSQGSGAAATSGTIEANSTDGFYSKQNLVVNGSGEAGSRFSGATVSAGTFAITTTAADVGRGAQSLTWDPTATAQTFTTTQVTVPSGLFAATCVAEFDMKGADANINWQIWDGTSIIASFNGGAAKTLATSATYTRQSMGFTCPSSGTVGFKFTSTANAAIMKVDSLTIRRQDEPQALLTGFVSGAGTCAATDSILQCLNKLAGNDVLSAPIASPTFTGVPAAPTAAPGTNTTQIATTAFVTAALASGGFSTLQTNTTQVGNTAATETDLFNYSIPGATLATNGNKVSFVSSGTFAISGNADKQIRVYFGATNIFDTGLLTYAGGGSWRLEGECIRTGAATQKCSVSIITSGIALTASATYSTAAETLSGAVVFRVTGTATGASDVVGEMHKIIFEP